MNREAAELFDEDIDSPEPSWAGRWSLNAVLAVLGVSVLAIAFYGLDPRDPRTLYNPWTYVVLLPVVLLVISTLLKTFVSRVVERSLQATFLLSVLAHLLTLAYASNVVVFSQPWSDAFDKFAESRQQFVRDQQVRLQSQQAKQYFQVSNSGTSQSNFAADFSYVPTQHDPGENASIRPKQLELSSDETKLAAAPEMERMPTPTEPAWKRAENPPTWEAQVPDPSEGMSWPDIERTIAGGDVGPPVPSSQPVVGEWLAAPTSEPSESLQPSVLRSHRNATARLNTPTRLPSIDAPQNPSEQSDSNIVSPFRLSPFVPSRGHTPQAIGDAAAEDVARLSGSGGNIERSAIGLNRPPNHSPALERIHEGRVELESPSHSPLSTIAPSATTSTQRSRSRNSDATTQSPLDVAGDSLGNLPRSDLAESKGRLGSGRLSRRSHEDNGLSATPQIASLSIDRSPVGRSVGPTTSVAVPKPAFSQRLERLENRDFDQADSMEPQTELAIERGLEFLSKYQRPDGSWRLQDFDTEVLIRSDTAATALSLLAFQGAGYTHVQSKYAKQIERAIGFLAAHQKPSGDLYIPQDPASDQNAWLYSHSIASLALCEAYGMTQDERLKPIAQRAVDFMVASQDPRRGGWRYRPGIGSDTSVTGWYMMALQSGKLAGLEIPTDTFQWIERYVDNAQVDSNASHLYRYNPFAQDTEEQRHGLRPTAVMTSVGLLIRLYLGWHRERPEMIRGANFLLDHVPQHGSNARSLRDTYYWYYATQVVFHVGGDHWKRWHETLYPLLVEHQVTDGPYVGSWAPMEPVPDLWARYGGRLYVTTLNLLSLEIRYRHLPLYEATAK